MQNICCATDFDYVLDALQHDGYLTETDNGASCFFSHPAPAHDDCRALTAEIEDGA